MLKYSFARSLIMTPGPHFNLFVNGIFVATFRIDFVKSNYEKLKMSIIVSRRSQCSRVPTNGT
jgi:hypothetical protein